jgi:hypothetical protein
MLFHLGEDSFGEYDSSFWQASMKIGNEIATPTRGAPWSFVCAAQEDELSVLAQRKPALFEGRLEERHSPSDCAVWMKHFAHRAYLSERWCPERIIAATGAMSAPDTNARSAKKRSGT